MTKGSKKKSGKGPSSANLPGSGSSAAALLKRKRSVSTDRQSSVGQFQTPPTSPVSPEVEFPSMIGESAIGADETAQTASPHQVPTNGSVPTADEIASGNQDIIAMADVFATMKKALLSMTDNLERLGNQSERMVSFALDIKAADQVCTFFVIICALSELVQLKELRFALTEQIGKQREEVEELRLTLESKIKLEVEGRIRDQLRETVKVSIREKVQEKVHEEVCFFFLHKNIISWIRLSLRSKSQMN